MALIARTCRDCGRVTDWHIGEAVINGELLWHAAYRCEHCGGMLEMDGRDELPPDFREAVLRQDGEWSLTVPSADSHVKVAALQALREALGITLAEAKVYLGLMPGVVRTGTRGEMVFLQRRLERRQVPGEVKRVS